MLQNRHLKKRPQWGGILFSLGLVLILGSTSWSKTGNVTKHIAIVYSSNTSGFTEPSG